MSLISFLGNTTPALSSFVTDASTLIFYVIGQTPAHLDWLNSPVAEWESSPSYRDFHYYVTNKHVVNDAAERCILNYFLLP